MNYKEKLLQKLKEKISGIREKIMLNQKETETLENRSLEEIKGLKVEDQAIYMDLKAHAKTRIKELENLHHSPFFVRCDIYYQKTGERRTIYFAKHQFAQESIFSWTAPIATIRFESPGNISWKLPDGSMEKAVLESKDQYLIVDEKILFYATEEQGKPRDLIYQEHFSTRKNAFILPEIVSIMEKAQDQVIRAHHVGPFVISGPAGSGKTTLALHRVAYLVQAPDTAHMYPSQSSIVFVQDTGTKEYFSQLLPELGINDVKITTFNEWVAECLEIAEKDILSSHSLNEESKDMLEFEKIKAFRLNGQELLKYSKQHFTLLENIYSKHLSKKSYENWLNQKRQKKYDKTDLMILLSAYLQTFKKIIKTEHYFVPGKNGELKSKTRKTKIEYSLMIIDEFQNYLPEQLTALKQVMHEGTKSMIYVGDMAQQVRFGTIKSFEEIGEKIDETRRVMLQKVYRNTFQILQYINSLGYSVTVPEGLKQGPEIKEIVTETKAEEFFTAQDLLSKTVGSVGILVPGEIYATELRTRFEKKNNLFVMTFAEAQGVEFDTVIIMGIEEKTFVLDPSHPVEFNIEKKKINKDLLYVALTRANNELCIVGRCKLNKMI